MKLERGFCTWRLLNGDRSDEKGTLRVKYWVHGIEQVRVFTVNEEGVCTTWLAGWKDLSVPTDFEHVCNDVNSLRATFRTKYLGKTRGMYWLDTFVSEAGLVS
jgi:hypothetical protein